MAHMNYAEFLGQLRTNGRGRFLLSGGAIRERYLGGNGRHCPISFIAGVNPCAAETGGAKLGLPSALISVIVDAADRTSYEGPERREMLDALGL